ncbi:MAG: hypothetical protein KIS80_07265 [Anaerolineales bacterium]|nr:hypothetical protein [Anaerolineales bacterium]
MMDDLSNIRNLIAHNKRAEALQALNTYLVRNPRQEEAWLLTEGLLNTKAEKERLLRKGLEFLPNSSKLRSQLGEIHGDIPTLGVAAEPAVFAVKETEIAVNAQNRITPVKIVDIAIPFWSMVNQIVAFYFASIVAGVVVFAIGVFLLLGLLFVSGIFGVR